jgi:hypothetical protein
MAGKTKEALYNITRDVKRFLWKGSTKKRGDPCEGLPRREK